jgi:hypothetical protein
MEAEGAGKLCVCASVYVCQMFLGGTHMIKRDVMMGIFEGELGSWEEHSISPGDLTGGACSYPRLMTHTHHMLVLVGPEACG